MNQQLRSFRRPELIRALYGNEATQSLLRSAAEPLPEALAQWLGKLALLEGVPFNAIVPDARMLPQESIRFFFLDRNWIDALVDGAYSMVAAFDGQHAQTAELLGEHVRAQAWQMALTERRRRRQARRAEGGAPAQPQDAEVWTGFLIRSAAVQDWPGLRVRAFLDRNALQPVEPMRIARLSPTVLLALFAGRAQRFDIAMPAGALCLGVEKVPGSGGTQLRVPVRGLGGAIPSGEQVKEAYAQVVLRPDSAGRRVLDVVATQRLVTEALVRAYGSNPAPPVDPGGFAIEMTAGSRSQSFYNGPSLDEGPSS